jgi:acetylornithine deacetylase/succinyl-diaminopimelate desuccinylase-like protein
MLRLTVLALALTLPASAAAESIPTALTKGQLVEASRARLDQLVATDTTNPPGNERALADAVAADLAGTGLTTQILGPDGPRASLLVTLPKTCSGCDAKPLLIVAHVDVVGFDRDAWTTDPLALTETDGFLYGRGVIDNKGMAAAAIELLRHFDRKSIKRDRDIVLLLAADEEAGGKVGTGWLLEHHPEQVAASVVLNEGGDVRIADGRVRYVGFQATEKLSRTVTLVAEGQSGHSSMPLPHNAIARLGGAVAAVSELTWPMRTNTTTRAFLEGTADTFPDAVAAAARAVAQVPVGGLIPDDARDVLAQDPFLNAFLRSTCVATMIDGGVRSNALPGRASAKVNCRILPDEDWSAVVAALRAAASPFDVTIEASEEPKVSPVSPVDGSFFALAAKSVSRVWKGAVTVPFMSTGGTDCRRFRLAGAACYGILPFPLTAEDERRMHGVDERVGTEDFGAGVIYLYDLVSLLVSGKLK